MPDSNLPNPLSQDSCSPTAVHFCTFCEKPFINESSRQRHIRYCANRKRNRQRSCRACKSAKIKCSFETPCSRCMKKSIECVYEGSATLGRRALPISSVAAHEMSSRLENTPSALHTHGLLFTDENAVSTQHPALEDASFHVVNGNSHLSVDFSTPTFSLDESLNLDGLLEFEDYTSGQLQRVPNFSVAPWNKTDQQQPAWCLWPRRGFSLSMLTETSMVQFDSNPLAILQMERPIAQHNADLIIQSLRAFPNMMLRRETFPWFIHPQSQLLSKPAIAALPEALATCMSIAQMFALRTFETKGLVWSTIRAEFRRFVDEKHNMSIFELLAAVQACMVYLIMCIVEQSPESEKTSLELLVAIHDLYFLAKQMSVGSPAPSGLLNSGSNWEDWIFAESQRRLANLWFLIGCVICVKTGVTCDPLQTYRHLPLPSPKSLWEAASHSAWELEYEASRILQTSGLVTLGDLIDVQKSALLPSNAQKLDKWNAGVDNLGSLLNLVGVMV